MTFQGVISYFLEVIFEKLPREKSKTIPRKPKKLPPDKRHFLKEIIQVIEMLLSCKQPTICFCDQSNQTKKFNASKCATWAKTIHYESVAVSISSTLSKFKHLSSLENTTLKFKWITGFPAPTRPVHMKQTDTDPVS